MWDLLIWMFLKSAWEILWNPLLIKAMNWSIVRKCLISLINDWKQFIEQRNRSNAANYHQNNYKTLMLLWGNKRVAEMMINFYLFYWNKEFKILILLLWKLDCGIWLLSVSKFQDICGMTTSQFFCFLLHRNYLIFFFQYRFSYVHLFKRILCTNYFIYFQSILQNYPSLIFSFLLLKPIVSITTRTSTLICYEI